MTFVAHSLDGLLESSRGYAQLARDLADRQNLQRWSRVIHELGGGGGKNALEVGAFAGAVDFDGHDAAVWIEIDDDTIQHFLRLIVWAGGELNAEDVAVRRVRDRLT